MIHLTYVKKIFRDHRGILIVGSLLIGALQLLILTLVSTIDILGILQFILQSLPEPIRKTIGEQFFAQFTLGGVVAFGYNHPLVITFLSIVAIILPANHLAGEIESGALEIILSLPVRRTTIALSLWVASAGFLLMMVLSCWSGTLIGTFIFPGARSLPFTKVILLGVNLWLLMLTISGYTFLFSAYAREGGKAAIQSAALTLFFYFLNYAAKIWAPISFMESFTIFHYYRPQQVMMGEPGWLLNMGVLGGLMFVLMVIAIVRLQRRDIPG